MKYLGNLTEDQIIDFCFSTHKADGTPIDLVNGTVSVYKANGVVQSTEGVTLVAPFDSTTGLAQVRIDTSAHSFYAVANDYSVVITAGTVDGVSVVGTVLATFSIENRLNVLDELTAGHAVAGSAGKALTDILADTGTDGVVVATASKTGYGLAADGLDSITVTEPTGKPTTFRGWLMWLVQRFRRASKTPTTILVKTEAGATVTTQTVTDDGAGTETLGPPT